LFATVFHTTQVSNSIERVVSNKERQRQSDGKADLFQDKILVLKVITFLGIV